MKILESLEKLLAIFFVLIIPSVFLLLHGLWLLKGGSKSFYMAKHIYAGRVYAEIPGGITLFCWALAAILQPHTGSLILLYLGGGFFILALVFNFTQPTFLKPAWLKWLESEHHEIMDLLIEDAHAMGLDIWQKRVETQAGLEAWVAEVRRKHGLHR